MTIPISESELFTIAKTMSTNADMIDDLVQEAWIYLLELLASNKLDSARSSKAYACTVARNVMSAYRNANTRIVPKVLTQSEKKAIDHIRKHQNDCPGDPPPSPYRIREATGIPLASAESAYEYYFSTDTQIDAMGGFEPYHEPDDQACGLCVATKESILKNKSFMDKFLRWVKQGLGLRAKAIIDGRWLAEKKMTLKELANEFKLTVTGAAYLEKVAIRELSERAKVLLTHYGATTGEPPRP